jgi:hypothetical protein
MQTSSCFRRGCFFAFKKLVGLDFSHTHLYLKYFSWLMISLAVNKPCEVNAITPLGLMIRKYCTHNSSSGMQLSQAFWVILYGKSQRIISMYWSGISFIFSRQSASKTRFKSRSLSCATLCPSKTGGATTIVSEKSSIFFLTSAVVAFTSVITTYLLSPLSMHLQMGHYNNLFVSAQT